MLYYEQYYIKAELPDTPIEKELFVNGAYNDEILSRVNIIVSKEAPILKDVLTRKLLASFKINKSSAAQKLIDGALKKANVKQTKHKGSIIYWNELQDPNSWSCFRCNSDRSSDEIPLVEVKNAICYTIQQNGPMAESDALKSASSLLGYKKLGSNLNKSLKDALKLAIANKEIIVDKEIISICANDGNTNIEEAFHDTDGLETYNNAPDYKIVEPNAVNVMVEDDNSVDKPNPEKNTFGGIISAITDEFSQRSKENKQLSNKIQQEKERIKAKREKTQKSLVSKIKPVGFVTNKVGEKRDSKQLDEFIESETRALQVERTDRLGKIASTYTKKAVIAVIVLIGIIVAFFSISGAVHRSNIHRIQEQIMSDLTNPTQIVMNNFGTLNAGVPSDWAINEEVDNSKKANGSFNDPVTTIQRFLNDKDANLIVAEDIRYLGEDKVNGITPQSIAEDLIQLIGGDSLNSLEKPADNTPSDLKFLENGAWSFTSSNDETYRIYSNIFQLDESYYAISGLFADEYYTDEMFKTMVSNAGFKNYKSAVPKKLNIAYDGSSRIDTKIDKNNKGLKITADFDNGLSKNILDKISITGDADTLELGKTSNYTISYSYADTTIDGQLSIACTSEFSNLKVYYNGSTARGTEINDLKDFSVKAVYITPEEDDYEKDVTNKCTLNNTGILEANQSQKFAVTYEDKSASYNVECSTKATITAEYNGSKASGTNIDSINNFVVNATFTDEKYPEMNTTEDVTDKAKLENTATLSPGREDTFTISCLGATTTCTVKCSTPAAQGPSTMTYILNTSTMKFHYPGCHDTKRISANNYREESTTREDLINRGYSPCGHCNP